MKSTTLDVVISSISIIIVIGFVKRLSRTVFITPKPVKVAELYAMLVRYVRC